MLLFFNMKEKNNNNKTNKPYYVCRIHTSINPPPQQRAEMKLQQEPLQPLNCKQRQRFNL